ncbi:serine hydrolase domain-containing protein [Psychrobacillus sp. FJAT-51614]|uniref:Serine hydrolase domain-containing protein n=1 Tax=Psychrobacillus mangrovi TaxID=3117745 RepID=A0ABU8F6K6_9BACI
MNLNIEERMQHYSVQGLSIALINKGQISLRNYGVLEAKTNREVTKDSIFNACSISKFATAILVIKLVSQGIIDLDEDVNAKLKTWKVPKSHLTKDRKVTLRNLLCHQSGIVDPEGSFSVLDPFRGKAKMSAILEGNTPYCTEAIKVTYEPESEFQYADVGFCIIEQLLEDVSEKPFKQLMAENIFKPLNMNNSWLESYIPEDRKNYFSCGHNKQGNLIDEKYPIYPYPAAAGLWTTPEDLAILFNELMEALKGAGKLGISKRYAEEMISSQGCAKWTGLGLFLDHSRQELEISSLGWGVGFQCMLAAYPDLETGVVIMTNTDLGVHQMNGIIGEIYKSLEKQLILTT